MMMPEYSGVRGENVKLHESIKVEREEGGRKKEKKKGNPGANPDVP